MGILRQAMCLWSSEKKQEPKPGEPMATHMTTEQAAKHNVEERMRQTAVDSIEVTDRTNPKTVWKKTVPKIPSDIAYGNENQSPASVAASKASGNPLVLVGMGLTTVALLGMFRASLAGDKHKTQRYMRYRIGAQFFTVMVMVAGVAFYGSAAVAKKS